MSTTQKTITIGPDGFNKIKVAAEAMRKAAPQNEKLAAIAKRAAVILEAQIIGEADKILEAWDACTEEAQANDTEGKLKLGFAVTLDLGGDCATYALSFGIRRKIETSESIPDPNQPELPIGKQE